MVDIDMPDVGSPLLEQINALGPLFGIVLICAGIFLMLRGHERLQYVAGAVGGGIGYVFTPIVHDLIPVGTVSELSLMFILILLSAGIMLMTIQMSIHLMASFGIYICFSWTFQWLDGQGFEVTDSEFITNAMAVVAFFSVIWIRKKLPMLVSGLLGSIATLAGMLVLNGQTLEDLNPRSTSTMAIVLVFWMLSISLQMRAIKRKHESENPEEVKDTSSDRKRSEKENPYQYRRPSEYDLPDIR
ncbi:MAG: hypothetical protein DWC04_07315 [Candidatus Poseidoniales archaeon]|nr:MAG: hypothetical protein DWC04_07315 [Candidatus Poseidoniales archaeon]